MKRITRSSVLAGAFLIVLKFPSALAFDISDDVRYAAYRPFLQLATHELDATYTKNNNYSYNAAVEELTKKAVPLLKVGDAHAVRLLVGLGLFSAVATNKEPLDVTFKLACEAAKRGLAPRNVGDPLTCAVIALYGSRGENATNRTLAKEMLELAITNVASDPEPTDAKHALEVVAPIIRNCAP
jgi:hypothetical protein